MKNTINNNINNCFGHHVLLKPSKCSVTPTYMTPKQYKELIADHILSGVKKTQDGNIYKPNPHNVTSEQITISYIDPETGQTVEPTILTEAFNQLLQDIHEEYQNRGTLTLIQTDFNSISGRTNYNTKSNVEWEMKSMTQTDIDNIL